MLLRIECNQCMNELLRVIDWMTHCAGTSLQSFYQNILELFLTLFVQPK